MSILLNMRNVVSLANWTRKDHQIKRVHKLRMTIQKCVYILSLDVCVCVCTMQIFGNVCAYICLCFSEAFVQSKHILTHIYYANEMNSRARHNDSNTMIKRIRRQGHAIIILLCFVCYCCCCGGCRCFGMGASRERQNATKLFLVRHFKIWCYFRQHLCVLGAHLLRKQIHRHTYATYVHYTTHKALHFIDRDTRTKPAT